MNYDSGGGRRRGRPPNQDVWAQMADPRLWIVINGSDNTMDTDDTDTVSQTAFNKLTPGQKFKLTKTIVKPQETFYDKTGGINILVTTREANRVLDLEKIDQFPIKVQKHQYKNRVRGVISSHIVGISPTEEIVEDLTGEGVIHVRKLEKIERDKDDRVVKDQNNKIKFVPNGAAVVTFEKEVLPNELVLFGQIHTVAQYEPDPLQCKKCYQYGHLKKRCREAVAICGRCSQKEHTAPGEKCNNPPKCRHDEGQHANYNKDCPTWVREKEISMISELQKVTYWEAKRRLEVRLKPKEKSNRSYASMSQNEESNLTKNLAAQMEEARKDFKTQMNNIMQGILQNFTQQMQQMVQTIQLQMCSLQTQPSPGLNTAINQQVTQPPTAQPPAISPLSMLMQSTLSTPTRNYITAVHNERPTVTTKPNHTEEVPVDPPDPKKKKKGDT